MRSKSSGPVDPGPNLFIQRTPYDVGHRQARCYGSARQVDYFKDGLSNTLLAIEQSQRCRRSL